MTRRTTLTLLTCLAFTQAPCYAAEDAAENGAKKAAAGAISTMTRAAHQFLASLSAEQRSAAHLPFADEERFEMRLAPMPAWGGLKTGDMNLGQQLLMNILLSASLSAEGYQKAAGVMALEGYLVDLETAGGRVPAVHGMERYTVAIFGEPKSGETWGWRLQGHHLSQNFTVANGTVTSNAPAYHGAEPHYVADGPRKGWHLLGDEETLGRRVMKALSEAQRKQATIAEEMPRDLFVGRDRTYDLETPRGVLFADLGAEQQAAIRDLVTEYVDNARADVALRRRELLEKGGWENVRFAWIGSLEPGERMYYRVQGPEFLIEYCAVALSRNHVHTIWREKNGDFGRDLLAEHMNSADH